jgi:hypothetical protein
MAIQLNLEINEVNGILTALGQIPYAQVVELVDKIKQQAIPQVHAQQESEETNEFSNEE